MATHGTGSVPVVSACTLSFRVISQLLCLLGRRKRERRLFGKTQANLRTIVHQICSYTYILCICLRSVSKH